MKGFEKWYLPDKDIYINEYEMQKRAWKAALEWAISQRTSGIEEDGTISYCNYVSLDRLEEELGNE